METLLNLIVILVGGGLILVVLLLKLLFALSICWCIVWACSSLYRLRGIHEKRKMHIDSRAA